MDEIRDIQNTDNLSRFVDGQNIKTNPFGENRAAERAYRRAERIAAALYLLTNHISSVEPVRITVRNEAENLLASILSVRDEMRSSESSAVHAIQTSIRHLISLVRILAVSGSLSGQNANTMIEALDELGNFLVASQRSILSENITLSRDELLDVRGQYPSRPLARPRPIKDVKDTVNIKDSASVSDTPNASVNSTDSIGQDVRTRNIIEILRVGGSLGIKDISSNLPEYSEKMIQRELLGMVARGQIHKTGLKRWSKYSIAL